MSTVKGTLYTCKQSALASCIYERWTQELSSQVDSRFPPHLCADWKRLSLFAYSVNSLRLQFFNQHSIDPFRRRQPHPLGILSGARHQGLITSHALVNNTPSAIAFRRRGARFARRTVARRADRSRCSGLADTNAGRHWGTRVGLHLRRHR